MLVLATLAPPTFHLLLPLPLPLLPPAAILQHYSKVERKQGLQILVCK